MSVESIPLQLGPDANGMLLSPEEFDAAECERGWRYELIRGVLIVTPSPLEEERDPNEELQRRIYQASNSRWRACSLSRMRGTISRPESPLALGSSAGCTRCQIALRKKRKPYQSVYVSKIHYLSVV